jgi:hypothetical protein
MAKPPERRRIAISYLDGWSFPTTLLVYTPVKVDEAECFETSKYKILSPEITQMEQYNFHNKNLKSHIEFSCVRTDM